MWSQSARRPVGARRFFASVVGALAAVALTPVAAADPVASDSFAYPAGETLNGQNGGAGWSAAWSESTGEFNPALDTIAPGNLARGALAVTGNSVSTNGEFGFAGRNTTASLGGDGSVLWVSFLLRKDTAGNGGQFDVGDYGGIELGNSGGNPNLFVGALNDAGGAAGNANHHYGMNTSGGSGNFPTTVLVN